MSHRDPMDDLVLETDRLLLRRWRVSDAAVQRRLWTERDPRVPPHRRIDPDGRPTLEDIESWFREQTPEPTLGLLAAVHRDSGEVIGYSGLIANAHGQAGEPELAYEFLREVWGHGYATEASSAVIAWAARSGYRRLWATVRVWNDASRRVMTKLGFRQTERVVPDETYGTVLFYAREI